MIAASYRGTTVISAIPTTTSHTRNHSTSCSSIAKAPMGYKCLDFALWLLLPYLYNTTRKCLSFLYKKYISFSKDSKFVRLFRWMYAQQLKNTKKKALDIWSHKNQRDSRFLRWTYQIEKSGVAFFLVSHHQANTQRTKDILYRTDTNHL